MSKLTLCLLFGLYSTGLLAQDSLKYDYVILDVDIKPYIIYAFYSDGTKEDLMQKLHLSDKAFLHQLKFSCFQYLNSNGYDLVCSNLYQQMISEFHHIEYTFKRKSRLNK